LEAQKAEENLPLLILLGAKVQKTHKR
jgi:hypothetical protein